MIHFARACAVLATASLVAVPPASAQSAEEAARIIAEESAAYFGGLCISTRADPDKINSTIEAQQLKGEQLPDEALSKMFDAEPGDIGWLVMTNRDVGVKLLWKKTNVCQLETVDLDDEVLQITVESIMSTLASRERFTYEKVVDDRRKTNGGVQHLVGYRLRWRQGNMGAKVSISHLSGDGQDIPPQAQLVLTLEKTS